MLKKPIQFGLMAICRVAITGALIVVIGAFIATLGFMGVNILF